jgi:hypothetical protein
MGINRVQDHEVAIPIDQSIREEIPHRISLGNVSMSMCPSPGPNLEVAD